jgi:hypothetical protein
LKILGYGEDALTFWALTNNLPDILACVSDTSPAEECLVFYRPSFGRSGGPNSSQFGEFDFILATPKAVHLGETKWQSSPEVAEPEIKLREEQILRHRIFTIYYQIWIEKSLWEWNEFLIRVSEELKKAGINKPIPPVDSLLSINLKSVLAKLAQATNRSPRLDNLILVVDCNGFLHSAQKRAPKNFSLLIIDASKNTEDGFIPL